MTSTDITRRMEAQLALAQQVDRYADEEESAGRPALARRLRRQAAGHRAAYTRLANQL